MRVVVALVLAQLFFAAPALVTPARAQGQFEGVYTLSMAGLPIGKLTWRAHIGATDYTTSVSGRAVGIFTILLSGDGNVLVKGTMKDGRPQPLTYTSTDTRENEKTSVNITFDGSKVRDLKVIEPPPESDRVPITDAHKSDVIDPLSAFLIPGTRSDGLAPSSCQRTLPVFDGRRRFDLALSYRRLDKAAPEKGYTGPALVCAVKFIPISGHRSSSPLVEFLSKGRDIEIWFVPVAGTRLLAPIKLVVASVLGDMALRADQFETSPAFAPAP